MWFDPQAAKRWKPAIDHLRQADPRLAEIIDLIGPCTLSPRKDYFVVLCKAILSQQVSTKAAAAMFGRFRGLFPQQRPTPQRVLDVIDGDGECLRRCGFSRQKAVYVADLSNHFLTSAIPTRRLASMSDEEVIEALVKVKGIGRWTAEMFLIFTLNRPDVLPLDDLGLQKGVQRIYGLRKHPSAATITKIANAWKPYRSIGTWYVWRGLTKLRSPEATAATVTAGGVPETPSRPRSRTNPRSPARAPRSR